MHPLRLERFMLSDVNPMLRPLQAIAHAVRENRRPVAPDNPFVKAEHAVSQQIEQSLDLYRELRDRDARSSPSKRSTTRRQSRRSPGCARRTPMPGSRAPETSTPSDCSRPRSRRSRPARSRAASPRRSCGSCSRCARAEHMFDARGLRLAQRIKQEHPRAQRIPARAAEGRGQGGGLHDPLRRGAGARRPAAHAADRAGAARGLEIVRRIGYADGEITPEGEAVLGGSSASLGSTGPPRQPEAACRGGGRAVADSGPATGSCATVRSRGGVGPPIRHHPIGGQDEEGAGSGRDRATAEGAA